MAQIKVRRRGQASNSRRGGNASSRNSSGQFARPSGTLPTLDPDGNSGAAGAWGDEDPATGEATGVLPNEEAGAEDDDLTSEISLSESDDRTAEEPARPGRRRPGRPRRDGRSATALPKAPPLKLGSEVSKQLLTVLEGLMVPQLGEDARFADSERKLIEPPLGRILARLTPESAGVFAAFADPLMLGTGILLWAMRVFARAPVVTRPTLLRPDMGAPMARPAAPAPPPPVVPRSDGGAPITDDLFDAWNGGSL